MKDVTGENSYFGIFAQICGNYRRKTDKRKFCEKGIRQIHKNRCPPTEDRKGEKGWKCNKFPPEGNKTGGAVDERCKNGRKCKKNLWIIPLAKAAVLC